MRTILILYGGKSGEHEVSLRSAASITLHLQGTYRLLLVGITKEGRFYLQPETYPQRVATEKPESLSIEENPSTKVSLVPGEGFFCQGFPLSVDIVFPVLHGTFGEDGTIQGLLETLDIPYVGSGVLGSSVGMDKDFTKRLWIQAGLPVAPYGVVHREDWKKNPEQARSEAERLGYPVFVKPARIGSSVGISKVKRPEELPIALERAFSYDTKALIEKGIDAREIECSVIGNQTPQAFTPGEVVPSHEFYDYEAKYIDPEGARLLVPAPLPLPTQQRVKELAQKAYVSIQAEGFARVDFFLEKSSGELYLNEINTIPGFTSISMFPRMCGFDGLGYAELLQKLLDLAWERYRTRKSLCYDYLNEASYLQRGANP